MSKRLVLVRSQAEAAAPGSDSVHLGPWSLPEAEYNTTPWPQQFGPPPRGRVLAEHARVTEQVAEHLLAGLREELNARHGRRYSSRYWRILLMPWLITLIQNTFDRFRRLQELQAAGTAHDVALLPASARLPPIRDTRHFLQLAAGDQWTLLVCSRLLLAAPPPGWRLHDSERAAWPPPRADAAALDRKLRAYQWIVTAVGNVGGVQFYSVYGLSLLDAGVLSLAVAARRLRNLVLRIRRAWPLDDRRYADPPAPPPRAVLVDDVARTLSVPPQAAAVWLNVVEELAHETLPAVFGSAFAREERRARRLAAFSGPWVRVLVCGPALGGDDAAKHYLGCMTERRGASLVITQHGGFYGLMETHSYVHMTDYRSSDCFLSWGWQSQGAYQVNVAAAASPMLSRERRRGSGEGYLLVGTDAPSATRRLESGLQPEDVDKYRADKSAFLDGLEPPVRRLVRYRPYPQHDRSRDEGYMRARWPDVPLELGSMPRALSTCRACIIDHPGTTLNVTLAADLPTILYWDEAVWTVPPEVQPHLDALRAAGVFHRSPAEAAAHLNAVAGGIGEWWHAPATRRAVDPFRHAYCRASASWRREWLDLFSPSAAAADSLTHRQTHTL